MSWVDWIIFVVPLLFVIGMAYHTRRYATGVATFLSAGRVCGRYVITVADVAGGLAVVTLVAQTEAYYKTGIAISFWNQLYAAAGIIMGLLGFCTYRYLSLIHI